MPETSLTTGENILSANRQVKELQKKPHLPHRHRGSQKVLSRNYWSLRLRKKVARRHGAIAKRLFHGLWCSIFICFRNCVYLWLFKKKKKGKEFYKIDF